jgi:DNA-binding winged helix-turn-helix (wHTH) protein
MNGENDDDDGENFDDGRNFDDGKNDDFKDFLRHLLEELERLGEKVDDEYLKSTGGNPKAENTEGNSSPKSKSCEDYAARGAKAIGISPLVNGHLLVLIDNVHEIDITPREGEVFRLLIEDDNTSTDDFVGWKNKEYLLKRMGHGGVPATESNLTSVISRLRKLFKAHATLHENFVQTSKTGDYRFAVRRLPGGHDTNESGHT